MEAFVSAVNDVVWSNALIYLCLGAGLFYSVLTRFAQVRHFKEMCKLLFSPNTSEKGISSFQALAVSLSGRVGVGNIAGVAAAIGCCTRNQVRADRQRIRARRATEAFDGDVILDGNE